MIEMDIAANAAINMEIVRPNGPRVVYGSDARQFILRFSPMISRNFGVRFFIVYHLSDSDRARAGGILTDFLRRDALHHNIGMKLPWHRLPRPMKRSKAELSSAMSFYPSVDFHQLRT